MFKPVIRFEENEKTKTMINGVWTNLEGFKFRVFRQIIFEKLNGRRAVAILRPSVDHLEHQDFKYK